MRTRPLTRAAILAIAALWSTARTAAAGPEVAPGTATPSAASAAGVQTPAPAAGASPAAAPAKAGSLRAQAEANLQEDRKLEKPVAATPCTTSTAQAIETLREGGDKGAYDCLMHSDGADLLLLAALAPLPPFDPEVADGPRNRITRALALYGITRMDVALSADLVRAVNPADRRLMRDAVHARRGRKSPSAAHEAVFIQFSWYSPDPKYTNGRLSAIDKANVAMIDSPPPPPEPVVESAADAMAEATPASPGKSWCGCSAGGGAPLGGGMLLVGLTVLGLARRRR